MPGIAGTTVLSKYKLQMDLKAPDARVYGFLAWGRYSAMVPNNMYQTLNPSTAGIGTGPFMLNGSYVPNDHVNYVKNPKFWKPGLPYLDAVNYKIIPDEQSRIAALRAGTIDGGVVSPDSAQAINGTPNLTVLHNLTAAFRELQFTVKAGENKPWADKRVRQAINFAINRQNLIDKVYAGFGKYSGHVAAGYGPWGSPTTSCSSKYEKYDLPNAEEADGAGRVEGLRRDDDDVLDAARLRGDGGADQVRPRPDRDQRQHRPAGPGHVRRQEQRRRLRLGSHRSRHARRRRRLRRRVQPGRADRADRVPEVVHRLERRAAEQPEADLAPRRQRPDHARHGRSGCRCTRSSTSC